MPRIIPMTMYMQEVQNYVAGWTTGDGVYAARGMTRSYIYGGSPPVLPLSNQPHLAGLM
jgi:hypothetical protein